MPAPNLTAALRRLAPDDTPDGELLARYVREQDDDAFAALVRRHGGMVRTVCRRVLRNDADADDATQATFLVLVRKAAAVRDRNGLANWLFGVAHNVALKARQTRTRRQKRESDMPPRPPEAVATDFAELLHAELAKLPAASRGVIVLCDLEGRTIADAGRELGIPAGTVASRLARGREQLAKRLRRYGLSVSGGLAATLFGESATAAVTFDPAAVSPTSHTLANEATRTMFMTPKMTKLLAALVALTTLGGTLAVSGQAGDRREARTNAPVPKKNEAVPDIVGAWVPVDDGGPLSKDQLVITFQADGKVRYEQGKQVEFGWYKTDETKDPKEVGYATPARANPANNKPPLLGIYRVEGDTLTLCLSEKARPTEFQPTDGAAGVLTSKYRRVKEKDEHPERRKNSPPAPKAPPADGKKVGPSNGFALFFTLSQAIVTWDGDDKLSVRVEVPVGRLLKLTDAKGRAVYVNDLTRQQAGPVVVATDDVELYDAAGNEKVKGQWKKLLANGSPVLYAVKALHDPKQFRQQFAAFLKDDALVLVVPQKVNDQFDPYKNLPEIHSFPLLTVGQPPKPGDPIPPPKK